MLLPLAGTVFLLAIPLATLRLYYILPRGRASRKQTTLSTRTRPAHLLVVLGSGGHTTEMLMMLEKLDITKFSRRTYVVSSGDNFSADRADVFEKNLFAQAVEARLTDEQLYASTYTIASVHRARKVHQSIYTAPFSSVFCLLHCLQILTFGAPPSVSAVTPALGEDTAPQTPDVILTNGPATGVIMVLAALIIHFFSFADIFSSSDTTGPPDQAAAGAMRTVYVESWARVKRLSLSGQILLWLVDRFIVQWETLLPATKGRGEYFGGLLELPKPLIKS